MEGVIISLATSFGVFLSELSQRIALLLKPLMSVFTDCLLWVFLKIIGAFSLRVYKLSVMPEDNYSKSIIVICDHVPLL